MYIIKKIDSENILFFSLKGIITEDQGARAVQELNSTVRNLDRGYKLILDVRRFKPASFENAVSITKSAIKLMSIKRPGLIIRSGPREILKLLDRAYLELSVPIEFTLMDADEYDDIISKLNENKHEYITVIEWIKDNLSVLRDGNRAPGEPLENDVDITSFALNGIALERKTVSFSATAFSHKGKKAYYRFSYCRDMAGGMGTQEAWALMTDNEAVSHGRCDFMFSKPGRYIVSVKASTSLDNWNLPEIPEARLSVFVRPDSEAKEDSKSQECYHDFPFSPGANIELIYNKESISPVVRHSTIYECDLTAQSMVIAYVNPESEYGLKFDSIDIAVPCLNTDGKTVRKGISIIASRRISNYPVSENSSGEALLARFTLPVEVIGLRCDRQFYRCDCSSFSRYIEAEIDLNDHMFVSGQDFTISDLSITGSGLKFFDDAPLYRVIKSMTDSYDKGEIRFRFHDPSTPEDEPHTVSADFQIMRKNFCPREACCYLGLRFTDMGVTEGSRLNHFITILQLEEKN